MLVTCALDDWEPTAGEEAWRAAVKAFQILRDDVWRQAIDDVPQLKTEPATDVATAQQRVLALLAIAPIGEEIFTRQHVGHDYVRNLWRFVQMRLSRSDATTAASSRGLLHDIGIAWTPRLSSVIGAEASGRMTAPVVGDGPGEWLRWLAAGDTTFEALRGRADLPRQGRGHAAVATASTTKVTCGSAVIARMRPSRHVDRPVEVNAPPVAQRPRMKDRPVVWAPMTP